MKKYIIAIMAFVLVALSVYVYQRNQPAQSPKQQQAKDMQVFFRFAKNTIPQLRAEIKKLSPENKQEIEHLQKNLDTYKRATLIAKKDFDALKNMSKEQLSADGQIWVPGKLFKDQLDGKLASKIIGGQNALAFAIFASVLDKTPQDKKSTMALLKMLIDKGLDVNAQAGEVLWVRNQPGDKQSYDYVANYPLVFQALLYSDLPVVELLLQHGATYPQETVNAYLKAMEEINRGTAESARELFSRYSKQAVNE